MESLDQIKSKLASIKNKLVESYHLKSIAIFGSFARNEQTENSDVDIMCISQRHLTPNPNNT